MNQAARIALLIFTAVGTAAAGSFTMDTLPPALTVQAATPTAGSAYLRVSDVGVFADARNINGDRTFAAAHGLDKDDYIGTVHLSEVVTLTSAQGLTSVSVPEPASLILFGSGVAAAAFRKRRRNRI